MKHLKKFENFHEDPMGPDVDTDEQSYLDYRKKMHEIEPESEEEEEGDWNYEEEMPIRRRTFGDEMDEKKSTTYKKSGLKNPEKADLNKNKKIEGWEKARGKAIEKSMEKRGRK